MPTASSSARLKPPFQLKTRPENGYDAKLCARLRCKAESAYIDGTKNIWDCDVPLCEEDYRLRPDAPARIAALDPLPKTSPPPQIPVVEEEDEAIPLMSSPLSYAKPKSQKLFG